MDDDLTPTGQAANLAMWRQHARKWERRYRALDYRYLKLEQQTSDAQSMIMAIQANNGQANPYTCYLCRWLADRGIDSRDLASFTGNTTRDDSARHAAG